MRSMDIPVGVAVDDLRQPFHRGYIEPAHPRSRLPRASPTLVLTNVSGANAGSYNVVVSSPYGSVTSSVVTLQVAFPPTIATEPQSQIVPLGTNATLSVAASGTAPFDYQWYFDGAELPGQTNSNLSIGAAYLTNAGCYSVVVTNPYGAVTSSVATLTVLVITGEPVSQTGAVGTDLTLNVVTTGAVPYNFQWYFNGSLLAGETTAALSLNDLQLTNSGNYWVVVTNLYGSVTSAVAVVTVGIAPGITAQPTNDAVVTGSTASFSVAVSGTGPFTYQWQFNGTNLPNGVITTVAGNGTHGYSGDGGAATNAELAFPWSGGGRLRQPVHRGSGKQPHPQGGNQRDHHHGGGQRMTANG